VSTLDKYEYKLKVEEIKNLISEKEYQKAMEIADTIDWHHAKSVMMLCTVSDLYKINRRFEESRDILLLAYDRHPGGRMIVYSLCELAIKMGDVIHAIEYYKEFVQIAPQDTGRFVLQYRLYEMQDVSLEERINVLEEFKKREYKEKWAYELAYLYHRVGLSTRCIEECDELILWFGDGKYVLKAMELKMLHQPLSTTQQDKYNQKKNSDKINHFIPQTSEAEISAAESDYHVKTVNVGQYDTINLQKELAESMKELLNPAFGQESFDDSAASQAAEEKEVDDFTQMKLEQAAEKVATEVFFGDTNSLNKIGIQEHEEILIEDILADEEKTLEQVMNEKPAVRVSVESIREEKAQSAKRDEMKEITKKSESNLVAVQSNLFSAIKENGFDRLLAQEYDGQITLALTEAEKIEKQITGQMSIAEVMAEWERMKKENEQKRMEDVRQRVLQQTGPLFTDFDMASKTGILAQLDEINNEAKDTMETLYEFDETDEAETEMTNAVSDDQEVATEEDYLVKIQNEYTHGGIAGNSGDKVCDDCVLETITEIEELDQIQENPVDETMENNSGESAFTEDEDGYEEEPVAVIAPEIPKPVIPETLEAVIVAATGKIRHFTPDEKKLFGSFAQSKEAKKQIVEAIDNINLAAYTGNVIITGEKGAGTVELAKNIVKLIQTSNANFSGKVAKITGDALNTKDFDTTMVKLHNGALIIEQAGNLSDTTTATMCKSLDQEKRGIILILEDTKKNMKKLFERAPKLSNFFTSKIDIAELNNDALIAYAKDYAKQKEYAIDEFGVLALYTRIEDMQTNCHAVTIAEVREIVEEAINHANRFSISHFLDVLVAKRYDKEDMIILREKDFY